MNLKQMANEISNNYAKAGLVAFILAASVLVFALAPAQLRAKSYVYADADASGTMDGSSSHPYEDIQDAIDKARKEKKNVFVKKGTYKENIVIKEDVDVLGEDRDDVIIIAKDDNKPVVEMHDDTELRKVTVKEGDRGIEVEEHAHVVIDKCDIVDNDKDGIKAEYGSDDEDEQLEVYNSKISHNGWNGIFAQERKSVIMNNEITYNKKDGIELEKGSTSYLEDNSIRWNDGDGLRLTIDGSEIWTKDNTYYDNGREGVEIKAKGKAGKIELKDSKFYKNDHWGVGRYEDFPFSDEQWNSSVMIHDNLYWENSRGTVSPVINTY